MNDLLDLLALTLVPGLGPRLTQALLDHFGSATAIRSASRDQLRDVPRVGAKLAESFATALAAADPQAEYDRAVAAGVSLFAKSVPGFPSALKSLVDAPHLLYVRGTIIPEDANAVAIVGSRNCSPYGLKTAHRLGSGLARAGFTVVSGLALGIDGAAHRGALDGGGRTLAVLANGLASVYPPQHVELAEQVAKQGALVTETPMLMSPQRGMFHARNRLISGLALAVVVIEANDKSGALITARHAAEQGRDVFTVPANVDSHHSAGSLKLLRDGAKLIRDIDDLLEDLSGMKVPVRPAPEAGPLRVGPPPVPTNLDPVQQKLWDLLEEPRHSDDIVRHMGLSAGELSKLLLMMEMKKVIRRAPGNVYERR